jgi:hypothetical protein
VFANISRALPTYGRQIPAKINNGRVSFNANQCVTLGCVSVHSQKLVTGTRQRWPAGIHGRHQLLFVFLTFVTGALLPRCGGGGKACRGVTAHNLKVKESSPVPPTNKVL